MMHGKVGGLRWVQLAALGGDALTDADLLDRFISTGDAAAFEVLVWRHQRLVFGVCRRVLQDVHDSEDAFQAAFLVLARKGRTIGRRDSIASWLYKVAYRCALSARAARARRGGRELPLTAADEPVAMSDAMHPAELHEWRAVLDEELGRLPARFREATVLCYLAGMSIDEAAVELGCRRGTVASRLARARERLRVQLGRRGVSLPASLAAAALAEVAEAAAPEMLVRSVLSNVKLQAAGHAVAAAGATALATRVVRAMFLRKVLIGAVALAAFTGILFLGGELAFQALAQGQPQGAEVPLQAVPLPAKAQPAARLQADKEAPALVHQFVGTLEPSQAIQIRSRVTGYIEKAAVKEGDAVKKGDLLFQIDSRPAAAALDAARATLAQADAKAKQAVTDLERFKQLLARSAVSREEYDRAVAEVAIANAAVQVARAAVAQAQLQLDYTRITAPIDGQVTSLQVEAGNLAASGDNAPTLATLVVVDPIAMRFVMDEKTFVRLQQLKRAGKVRDVAIHCAVAARDDKGFPHEARLRSIGTSIDPKTATIPVVAILPNPDLQLLPGMFMRVRVTFIPAAPGKP
jgi:RND family efflux transporter MFP subunit